MKITNAASARKTLMLILGILLLCFKGIAQDYFLTNKQADILSADILKEKTDSGKLNKFLKLAWHQILKPGELKTDLDSGHNYLSQAAAYLKRVPSNDNLGFFHLVYADYYSESGQNKTGDAELNKAIVYLKLANKPFLLGSAYFQKMERLNLVPETVAPKIALMQLAAAAFSKANNKRKQGDCLRLIADLRIWLRDDPRALPELDSAKRLYQEAKSGDWLQLHLLYAQYYNYQDNNEKQLESVLNALRVLNVDSNSTQAVRLKIYAAILYNRMLDYHQALKYCFSALTGAKKEKNNEPTIYNIALFCINNYGKIGIPKSGYLLLNNLEKDYPEDKKHLTPPHLLARLANYSNLQQYDKGQPYFQTLSDEIDAQIITGLPMLSMAYNIMINFCISSKQFNKAGKLFSKLHDVDMQLGYRPMARIGYLDLKLKMDTAKKDFNAAVRDLLAMKKLSDSIFSNRRTRQIKEMEVQYQTKKKDNESKLQRQSILYLTEQQKLEHAELKAAGVTKNIIFAFAVCLTIIAGLIYRQNINGRENNRIITGKNGHLQQLLNDNEFLMKEVHHRVKNNLQIVTSLLHSQSAYLNEGLALDAIMKSKGRVESIALIHQKLYKSQSQTSIYMPEYIQELVTYLKNSFVDDQHFWFDLAVDEIYLDVSDAVPIGLIINEGVTNAIKHAFCLTTKYTDKVVGITLLTNNEGLELIIKDSGQGFSLAEKNKSGSFGLSLIEGLSQDLGGKLSITNDDGAVVHLIFNPAAVSIVNSQV